MVSVRGSSMASNYKQLAELRYKDLVDTSSMSEEDSLVIATCMRQASVNVDVNESKRWSTSTVISARSNLVVGEVDYGRLSSCELSSQQSPCSMSSMYILKKAWLQRHQDRQFVTANSHGGYGCT